MSITSLLFRIQEYCFGISCHDIIGIYSLENLKKIDNSVIYKNKKIPLINIIENKKKIKKQSYNMIFTIDSRPFALIIEHIEGKTDLKNYEIYPLPPVIEKLIKLDIIWGLTVLNKKIYYLI